MTATYIQKINFLKITIEQESNKKCQSYKYSGRSCSSNNKSCVLSLRKINITNNNNNYPSFAHFTLYSENI